jgi:hypothetical protein
MRFKTFAGADKNQRQKGNGKFSSHFGGKSEPKRNEQRRKRKLCG